MDTGPVDNKAERAEGVRGREGVTSTLPCAHIPSPTGLLEHQA